MIIVLTHGMTYMFARFCALVSFWCRHQRRYSSTPDLRERLLPPRPTPQRKIGRPFSFRFEREALLPGGGHFCLRGPEWGLLRVTRLCELATRFKIFRFASRLFCRSRGTPILPCSLGEPASWFHTEHVVPMVQPRGS